MQVTNRFISRKLVQRCYDRALAIGFKGYAELYVHVRFFPTKFYERFSLLMICLYLYVFLLSAD